MKNMRINFYIYCHDLCTDCNKAAIFTEEAPYGWETMTEEERDDWAKEIFLEISNGAILNNRN